ncbi:MAG: hypothetical protein V4662_15575 [Verrucomicrobiota bacterium]
MMSGSNVQEYIDTPEARLELADFLSRTGDLPPTGCSWLARLSHWWDENPHAALHPLRGYVVRAEDKMVGFGGAIPTSYSLGDQRFPAIVATTLRVAEGNVQAGLNVLLKLRRLGQEVPVAMTTAVPKLREALKEMGAKSETQVTRRLVPMGGLSRILPGGSGWPTLDSSMRLITSVNDIADLALPATTAKLLEPTVSLESLCWQLTTPMHDLHMIGAVDGTRRLHSFLILRQRPRTMRAFLAWEVVMSWTARENAEELRALSGCLVRDPGLLGERLNWLTTTSFQNDSRWQGSPKLLERQEEVCHYFLLPDACREAPKLSMLAEGDLLL